MASDQKKEEVVSLGTTLALSLMRYPSSSHRLFIYGTAGFRARADLLPPVVFRCGIVAGLLALSEQKKADRGTDSHATSSCEKGAVGVGCMLTASHNPIEDNGVKLVGLDGCLLSPAWERLAERLINSSFDSSLSQEKPQAREDVSRQPSCEDSCCTNGTLSQTCIEKGKTPVSASVAGLSQEQLIQKEEEAGQKATHETPSDSLLHEKMVAKGDHVACKKETEEIKTASASPRDSRSFAYKEAEVFMKVLEEVLGKDYLRHVEEVLSGKKMIESPKSEMRPYVIVGRDNRPSSLHLEAAFIDGVQVLGVHVIRLGEVTTGQLQFIVRRWNDTKRGRRRIDEVSENADKSSGKGNGGETAEEKEKEEEMKREKERSYPSRGAGAEKTHVNSTAEKGSMDVVNQEDERYGVGGQDEEGLALIEDYYRYFEENFTSFMQQGRQLKREEETPMKTRGEGGDTLGTAQAKSPGAPSRAMPPDSASSSSSSSSSSLPSRSLYLDAANGVGALAAQRFAKILEREAGVTLVIRNDRIAQGQKRHDGSRQGKANGHHRRLEQEGEEKEGREVLNYLCGAEHVQKMKSLPRNFGHEGDSSENERCCAFDGDADRLVYFMWSPPHAFRFGSSMSSLRARGEEEIQPPSLAVQADLQRAFSLSDIPPLQRCFSHNSTSSTEEKRGRAPQGVGASSAEGVHGQANGIIFSNGRKDEDLRSALSQEERALCSKDFNGRGGMSLSSEEDRRRDQPPGVDPKVSEDLARSLTSSALRKTREQGDDECVKVMLYDGDRIACLFSLVLFSLLKRVLSGRKSDKMNSDNQTSSTASSSSSSSLSSSPPLKIYVVQTAYANGGSTGFLEKLQALAKTSLDSRDVTFELACVPTGVKHLHHKALQASLGIYFEANGHGTIVRDEAFLDAWAAARNLQNNPEWLLLRQFIKLLNPATGDALSNLLAVEASLQWLGMIPRQWRDMYDDRPCETLKVPLPRRILTTLQPDPLHEKRLVAPSELQEWIDDVVEHTGPFCRSFVRPSGTEDVCRVYAEAPTTEAAQALGSAVCALVNTYAERLLNQA
ncbi:phosphoacetylglucosamine mutase [Cystoisospora suis]|uniref:Phosphoacetylglucosamine mutase n=1 Tax=Cystoisospora suis TaxID=483139 RepID=A0A2C6KIE7_9APIC|nr:phosphoacetylglucosamine mutase [Cystoisospora suis]